MDTTYKSILPIVTPFWDIGKSFTTTICKNWHTIAFDTVLSTIWPNSATYIHLHTPTHINTSTVATLFSLPLKTPHNGSWWYWQHDGTPQQTVKINTHSTTDQHGSCHTGYLRISVYLFNGSLFWFNNIFFSNLCHCMVFSISEFPANI